MTRKSTKARKRVVTGVTRELTPQQVEHYASIVGDAIQVAAAHIAILNERWWRDPRTGRRLKNRNVGEMIALAHSELSEALEGDRKDSMDDKLPHRLQFEVELADAVIRILDTASGYHHTRRKHKLSIGIAAMQKLIFNHTRPDHQPKGRLKKGGKAY